MIRFPSILPLALVCTIYLPADMAEGCPAEESAMNMKQAYEQHYPAISYPDLRKAMDAGQVFLIDANSPKTYINGHLPLARSLHNAETLESQLPVLKNYPVAVYCGGPQCTEWHRAAEFVTARGYTSVMHYKGGIKGWKEAGDTFATGNEYK